MGGGSWAGTFDGSGWNARVTPQQSDPQRQQQQQQEKLTPRQQLLQKMELEGIARSRELAAAGERARAARRQEQLRLQTERDREQARKIAAANEEMCDSEFEVAGMTPQQKAECWMRMVDAKRVDLEFAQYLVAEYRAAKTQDALKAREERLKHLRNRHQYCWMLIEKYCRDRNLPDTLASYEQAITELKLEE